MGISPLPTLEGTFPFRRRSASALHSHLFHQSSTKKRENRLRCRAVTINQFPGGKSYRSLAAARGGKGSFPIIGTSQRMNVGGGGKGGRGVLP